MKVLKFGGTSVGSLIGFQNILKILTQIKEKVLVVVSAASGSTNLLLKIAESGDDSLIDQYIQKECDLNTTLGIASEFVEPYHKILQRSSRNEILAVGECISMHRLFLYATHLNPKMQISWDLNFIIEGENLVEECKEDLISSVHDVLRTTDILITTGFIGKNKHGVPVTLNRGGGDLSAALFASALDAIELQIWSDVPGVMTCDPRMIPNAKILKEMTYEEALELSFYGAKILHSKTVEPLVSKSIPLRVLNTFDLSCEGTLISQRASASKEHLATGLSFQRDMVIVYVSPESKLVDNLFLMHLFNKLQMINCSMISFSKTSVSFIVRNSDITKLNIENAVFTEGIAVISLVGEKLRDTHGIAAQLFDTIKTNIEMISQSHSQTNILVAIKESSLESVLNALHINFFEKE
jgi:aspartate kinase